MATDAFGLNIDDKGVLRQHCQLHYFPGGIVSEGGNTALQNAQLLASLCDLIVPNIIQDISGAGAIGSDTLHGMAEAMLAVNPDLMLMPYNKSAQITEGATFYPNNYYAHNCPWPTGAKLTTFSAGIYVAQPSVAAGQSPFADPRGWTSHSFKEQRTRDAWSRVTKYNALYGDRTLAGVMLDSMGPSTYKGTQCNPATGSAYTEDAWMSLVRSIGDEAISRRPGADYMVMGNGLTNGASYYSSSHPSSALMAHVNAAWAENWLHSNYSGPTNFHSEADWEKDVNMAIDVQVARNKWFLGTVNCCNDTAGSGTCSFADADYERWQRYGIATWFISNRGKSLYQFVSKITVKPWRTDHEYMHLDLGTPIDTPAAGANIAKTAGIRRRRYAGGVVYVNPTTSPVTITMDRDYTDPISLTSHASGSTISLQANRGIIFVTAAPVIVNPDSPVITVVSPAESSTVANSLVHLVATATDSDGVALMEVKVGAGSYSDMSLTSGKWVATVTLPALGANTVTLRATDANAAPNQSTHSFSLTLAANAGAPLVSIIAPTGTVNALPVTLQIDADDPDGISLVEYNLNSTGWQTAALSMTSGYYEASVSLLVGANSIQARATDARTPDPLTSSVATGTVTYLALAAKYATRRGCFAISSTPDSRSIYTAMPWLKVIAVTLNMDSVWSKQSQGPQWPPALRQSFLDAKLHGYKLLLIPQAGSHSPTWVYSDVPKVMTKLDAASQAVTPQPVYWDVDYYQGHWRAWWDTLTAFLRSKIGDTSQDTRDLYCAGVLCLPGSDVAYDMTTLASGVNEPLWDAATATTQAARQGLMGGVWADGIAHALSNKPNCPVIVPYGQLHGDDFAYALTVPAAFQAAFGSGDLIGMTTNLIEQDNGAGCGSQTVTGSYATEKAQSHQCIVNTQAVGGLVAMRLASFQGGFDQFTCFSDPDGAERAALLDACDSYLPNLKLVGGSLANYQGVEIGAAHPWPVESYAKGTIQPRVIAGA